MKDILAYSKLVQRKVKKRQHEGRPAYAIVHESTYDADVDDLWDVLTNKDRLPLWFAPVTGELHIGGRFRIEGNAEGSITRCDQPKRFDLTWEFGDDVSWVKVELIVITENRTMLRLEHLAFAQGDHWQTYGPGAGGVGWDLGIAALAYYLRTLQSVEPESFMASPEYKGFISFCSKDWGEAAVNAGYDRGKSIAAAKKTEKFYLGE